MALQSTISNTIRNPNGQAVSGVSVTVTLMPAAGFRIDDQTEVARSVSTTTDANGLWSLALEQNVNISPANTTYEVVELIPQSQGGMKVTTIQVGVSNQSVSAAQVAIPPAATQSSFLTQAAGDARYQALGSLGSGTPTLVSQTAGTAGASTSASRDSHQHQQPAATPRGVVSGGYVTAVANQGTITTEVDLTSLTVTFTAPAGRRYRITGSCDFFSSVANDTARLVIHEDGVQIQQRSCQLGPTPISSGAVAVAVTTPSAGSHTYKLRGARDNGTGNISTFAAATHPAFILVEDIGT